MSSKTNFLGYSDSERQAFTLQRVGPDSFSLKKFSFRKNEKDKKTVKRKNESQLIEKVAEAKKDQVMESKSESDLVETEREGSKEQNKDVLDEKE